MKVTKNKQETLLKQKRDFVKKRKVKRMTRRKS